MQNTLPYGNQRADQPRRIKPLLVVLGGVLYIVAALALMQVVFRIWIGMW